MFLKFSLKFFLLCCLLLLVDQATADSSSLLTSKPECSVKNQQKIELQVTRLASLGPKGRVLPENYQDVKGFCKESTQLLESVNGFIKNCYRKASQDIANVLIYSVKQTIRQFCRKRSKKVNQLLAAMSCFNKNLRADDGCINKFVDETKQLIPLNDHNIKLPYMCCNYVKFLRCQEAKMEKHACMNGPKKEIILDFIRQIFQNLVEVICGEHNESTDKCDTMAPAPKPPKPNPKTYNSFVFVVMEIIDSLPSP